jgi:hypothetical protein
MSGKACDLFAMKVDLFGFMIEFIACNSLENLF